MMHLLNSGITVVTLSDGKQYVPGHTDLGSMMYSVMVLSRAHEESSQKSQRLKAVWDNKRQNVHEQKITGRCPGWMCLSRTRKQFELIPERVEVVSRIYDEAVNGLGADAIARRLNQEGVEPFGISKGWQKSSVQKILSSRAVLGEFQPMRKIEGKRTPIGETVKNYYPPIIDEERFFAAQGARIARRMGGGGRKGDQVSNLFSKVARCGYCNSRMHYLNKGKRGGRVLVCDAARRGLGCRATQWNYLDFESSFLSFVRELDLNSIIGLSTEETQLRDMRAELLSIHGRLADARRRNDRIFELIMESDNPGVFLRGKLHENNKEIHDLESRKLHLENAEAEFVTQQREIESSGTSIASAVAALQDDSSVDLFKTRASVAQKISALVKEVLIYSGKHYLDEEQFKMYKELTASAQARKVINDFMGVMGYREEQWRVHDELKPDEFKKFRHFLVVFPDGSYRDVQPKANCPREYFILDSSKDGFSINSGSLPSTAIAATEPYTFAN